MPFIACLLLALPQSTDSGAVTRLVEDLDEPGIERRESAMLALRKLEPDSLDIDRLLEEAARKLGGDAPRRAALIRHYRIAARLVLDPDRVLSDLESSERNDRLGAVNRLLEFGGRAAPVVARLLEDPDESVCYSALRIVAASADPQYIPLVRPLVDQTALRTLAMQCLAAMGDKSILPRLREIVEREANERSWAVPLLAGYREKEDLTRFMAVFERHPGMIPVTISAMRKWDEAKRELAPALHRYAAEGIAEAILLAADQPSPELAKILRTLCLRDSTRGPASFALAAMGDRESLSFLLNEVRWKRHPAAIAALGRLKATEGIRLFKRMLVPGYPPLAPRDRAAFARASGEIGGAEAEELLLGLVDDPFEEVRFEAALGLGRMKSRRAVPLLVETLEDAVGFSRPIPPDPSAPLLDQYEGRSSGAEWSQPRQAAIEALSAITGVASRGTLDEQVASWRKWWGANRKTYVK